MAKMTRRASDRRTVYVLGDDIAWEIKVSPSAGSLLSKKNRYKTHSIEKLRVNDGTSSFAVLSHGRASLQSLIGIPASVTRDKYGIEIKIKKINKVIDIRERKMKRGGKNG